MDYYGKHCPVCKRTFEKGDNIVVCPECGTPHHRDCYDKADHCVNADRHKDGYSWVADSGENTRSASDMAKCPNCGFENLPGSLFCSNCSLPLGEEQTNARQQNQQPNAGDAQGGIPNIFFTTVESAEDFEKRFKVDESEDLAPGVKMKEAADYVQKNVPYYVAVFRRIRDMDKGALSVSAFVLTGAYYIYRKQYLKGIIITIIMTVLMLGYFLFLGPSNNIITQISQSYSGSTMTSALLMSAVSNLSVKQQLLFFLPYVLNFAAFILRFVCAFTAVKSYHKSTIKQITKIKASHAESPDEVPAAIKEAGGVNLPFAVSVAFCNLILMYVPILFM